MSSRRGRGCAIDAVLCQVGGYLQVKALVKFGCTAHGVSQAYAQAGQKKKGDNRKTSEVYETSEVFIGLFVRSGCQSSGELSCNWLVRRRPGQPRPAGSCCPSSG